MNTLNKNLDILFRRIQPEEVYHSIVDLSRDGIRAGCIPPEPFLSTAHMNYPALSREELDSIYHMVCEGSRKSEDRSKKDLSVFRMILAACREYLCFSGDKLCCRYEQVLEWRNLHHLLGQDMFTTAWYADTDLKHGINRRSFLWEVVLRSNHDNLHKMLSQGLAENHFHLNGSSQSFAIIWAYAMNHPGALHEIDALLQKNLTPVLRRKNDEDVWSWEQRFMVAAYLRARLFQKQHNLCILPDLDQDFYRYADLIETVESLRLSYGLPVKQLNAPDVVLDYAMENHPSDVCDHHNRILSGERGFLYQCYRNIFSQKWKEYHASLFYLYLIIKANVRSEFIQVNQEYGFSNFEEYQDRKEYLFEGSAAYERELIRMAIKGNMTDCPIKLLEARITPASTVDQMRKKINRNDHFATDGERKSGKDLGFYYVAHFIKKPDFDQLPEDSLIVPPRNAKARQNVQKQSRALYLALTTDLKVRSRLLGIDAASKEIGCRPEVFAEAFHTLRVLCPQVDSSDLLNSEEPTLHSLGITYHAGEDFCDMADGLRTIDEAMRFLSLQRGDRIGHAMVLGEAPEIHYRTKGWHSLLTEQDYLDNIVWLLFKALELDAPVSATLRRKLELEADQLIRKIYGADLNRNKFPKPTLSDYYNSWQLRGDPPEWYCTMSYVKPDGFADACAWTDPALQDYREDPLIAYLYACYHYSVIVRNRGLMRAEKNIDPEYMALIREIQAHMRYELAEKGIMIECNPTSNYLIGTFRDYSSHPLLTFCPVSSEEKTRLKLVASINTDDIGVFDTSLENEYVLMAAAIGCQSDSQGKRLYSDDEIERYLETIRRNGFKQSFRHGHATTQ